MKKRRITTDQQAPNAPLHPYRVFISFSHSDRDKAERVAEHLKSLGLRPRWTGTILPGMRFTEQIKEGIARAHLFLPVLTRSAGGRPWVHQEIGYALGMNVPVLPLAVGHLAAGMAEELQALEIAPDLSDLPQRLTLATIEYLVTVMASDRAAVFEHAEFHEDRTRMLVDSARRAFEFGGHSRIRQSGALSSFSLPDKSYRDAIWKDCDGLAAPRSIGLRRDLQSERQLLEEHARVAGCDLILDPTIEYSHRGKDALRARLRILIEFLERMESTPDNKVRVVFDSPQWGNLLIIGDWFLAESITPRAGIGYLQTLGTWHAPTVLKRLREFDREFERLLIGAKLGARSSRKAAIDYLEAIVQNSGRKRSGRAPAGRRRVRSP